MPIDGPFTLDLHLRRPAGRALLFLDAINITGNIYQEYGYTLTDFTGGVVPYAYAGARRAVRAGLTVAF